MIKERSYNTPNINVEKLIELLSSSYSSIINNKQPIKSFPSVMLWGAPGVGKSQAVRQIAREIEYFPLSYIRDF
jgi:replication-associated recombination protein RarA